MSVILVADDDRAVRRLLCTVLRSAGHKLLEAGNGFEAVALFRSNPDGIDLVITDMTMPVMNGAQAIARIRETRPGVPVILVTGYADTPAPPGVDVLQKPFSTRALLDLVARKLGQAV